MLFSSSSSWTRRSTPCLPLAWSLLLHPVPLRLLPATRGQCVYPATHRSPPLIQLFVSFFKLAPGDLGRCCLFRHGSLAEGNLWRAAVDCSRTRCLTNSLVQLSRVPVQAQLHPLSCSNYLFELKITML